MVCECLLSESLLCTVVAVAAFAFVADIRWPTGLKRTMAKRCKHRTDAKTKTRNRKMLEPEKRSRRENLQSNNTKAK